MRNVNTNLFLVLTHVYTYSQCKDDTYIIIFWESIRVILKYNFTGDFLIKEFSWDILSKIFSFDPHVWCTVHYIPYGRKGTMELKCHLTWGQKFWSPETPTQPYVPTERWCLLDVYGSFPIYSIVKVIPTPLVLLKGLSFFPQSLMLDFLVNFLRLFNLLVSL